uniref:Probable RNA-binding protein EIF1AD n=1 Tax=Parascaris univalens TaxID=6257 RepID=A0A915C6G3_PARUN
MSVASKRRFVTKQVESELVLPEREDIIAQILGTRGNNLHEVEDSKGDKYLVSMPTKFRKSIWVRRGHFVFVRPIEEGDKVKAEITNVLDDENVLYIREHKLWPSRFERDAEQLTREAKRDVSGDKKHEVIDADMLPPSESDDDEDDGQFGNGDEWRGESDDEGREEDNTDSEDGSEEDEDSERGERPIIDVYNPNRGAAPKHR